MNAEHCSFSVSLALSREMKSEKSSPPPPPVVAAVDDRARRIDTEHAHGRVAWREWDARPPVEGAAHPSRDRPLVLVHGGHGSWAHWLRNIDTLGRERRLLTPDIPGLGESDSIEPQPRIEALAEALLEGLDQILGPAGEFDLVGFSFGGIVSGPLARAAGERIHDFVMVGAGGLGVPPPAIRESLGWRHLDDPAQRLAAHRRNLEAIMLADPRSVDEVALAIQSWNVERATFNSRQSAYGTVLADALPHVRARVAAIWGALDALGGGGGIERRRDKILAIHPQAPFVLIAGAGHWVQYEAAPAFDRALLEVLARP